MKRILLLVLGAGLLLFAVLVVAIVLFVRSSMQQFAELSYPIASSMPPEVDGSMDEVLLRLERVLSAKAPQTLAALQPGLSADRITELEQQGGITLSPELRALYRWRNGMTGGASQDLIPGHQFPSLEQVIERKAAEAESLASATAFQRASYNAIVGYRTAWLPLFPDLAGDGYFYDPNRAPHEGAVFFHFAEMSHFVFFPSIKNLLAGIAECYETEVFSADSSGRLVQDYEKTDAVWRKYGSIQSPGY
ncbi:MAG TPA: SMI1/KNR4 family protein [Pirellulaceae bacterium]|nr:SMI1/KNR4 family protein [Pirellulaceae bacterium]